MRVFFLANMTDSSFGSFRFQKDLAGKVGGCGHGVTFVHSSTTQLILPRRAREGFLTTICTSRLTPREWHRRGFGLLNKVRRLPCRVDPMQASVIGGKLNSLGGLTAGREGNAAQYDQLSVSGGLVKLGAVVLAGAKRAPCAFRCHVKRIEKRVKLKTRRAERGVATDMGYPVRVHSLECFSALGYKTRGHSRSPVRYERNIGLLGVSQR